MGDKFAFSSVESFLQASLVASLAVVR